jgi:hypothetical protein
LRQAPQGAAAELIESRERHDHLRLNPVVRSGLLDVSAATIDRLLRPVREANGRTRRWRWGLGSAIRQSVPVRTFDDWGEPPPGYSRPIWSSTVAASMKAASRTA